MERYFYAHLNSVLFWVRHKITIAAASTVHQLRKRIEELGLGPAEFWFGKFRVTYGNNEKIRNVGITDGAEFCCVCPVVYCTRLE